MSDRILNAILAITCVALTVALVRTGAVPASSFPAPVSATTRTEADDQALLDRSITDVNFKDAGLTEALERLADLTKVQIFANWQALEGEGIDRNAPVTIHLRNVKLSEALTLIGDTVGQGFVHLAWTIDDGVVTVTMADDVKTIFSTEIYNVRDLLDELVAFYAAHPGATGGGKIDYETAVEYLIRAITDTVEPNSWRSAGGSFVSMQTLAGLLIVTQSRDAQTQIADLLTQIRDALHRHEVLPQVRRAAVESQKKAE